MGRDVTTTEDWTPYIPDVDDNKDDPEPVSVELHPLTAEENRAYQRGLVGKRIGGNLIERSHKVQERIFRDRVRNVKNYRVNGVPVLSGEDLFKRGEQAFIDDVYEALTNLSVLSKGALGK